MNASTHCRTARTNIVLRLDRQISDKRADLRECPECKRTNLLDQIGALESRRTTIIEQVLFN